MPPPLEARQLDWLAAIAATGSINKAAARCGLSQPALSNAVALLERQVGLPLVTRSRQGAQLTPQGAVLARRGDELRAMLDDALTEARLCERGIVGPLAIGITPSMTPHLLPAILAHFRTEYPDLSLTVLEGLDAFLLPLLFSGELDVVLGPLPDHTPDGIHDEPLFRDPLLVAVSAESRFARRRTLRLKDLMEELWITPRPGSAYNGYFEALMATHGVGWPARSIRTNSLALTEQLVVRLGAVSIISALQLAEARLPVAARPLEGGGSRVVGLRTRTGRVFAPWALRLLEIARTCAAATQVG